MKRFERLTVTTCALAAGAVMATNGRDALEAQSRTPPGSKAVISGPVGPSPYDVVRGWHNPFAEQGYAFGGNSGLFAESPNRILVAQRGETRLPDPILQRSISSRNGAAFHCRWISLSTKTAS